MWTLSESHYHKARAVSLLRNFKAVHNTLLESLGEVLRTTGDAVRRVDVKVMVGWRCGCGSMSHPLAMSPWPAGAVVPLGDRYLCPQLTACSSSGLLFQSTG